MYHRSPGTWRRVWLRHCAMSRKVEGSISNGTIGIHLRNSSGRNMALELNLLTKLGIRIISWEEGGKAAGV
jgi:hypothetical protein